MPRTQMVYDQADWPARLPTALPRPRVDPMALACVAITACGLCEYAYALYTAARALF